MSAPLPTEAEIRARLARHGLTEQGMAAQVRIVLLGLDTLDNLDDAWDRYRAGVRLLPGDAWIGGGRS